MGQVSRLMEEKNDLAREVIELREQLRKCRAWNNYEDWKRFNYTFDDYSDKYYKKQKLNGQAIPFSPEYTELDLRKEYIKLNNL